MKSGLSVTSALSDVIIGIYTSSPGDNTDKFHTEWSQYKIDYSIFI